MNDRITKIVHWELTKDERTEYHNDEGLLHREDGPAVIWNDGEKEWYINGERHREDGPAIIYANGIKEWYLDGRRYLTEEEHNQEMYKRNLNKLNETN